MILPLPTRRTTSIAKKNGSDILLEKIAEEGTVGGAFFAYGRPQNLFAKYYGRLRGLATNF